MSGPDMGEVPLKAWVFVMAPATWRRRFDETGEAMDPGMEMGSICRSRLVRRRNGAAMCLPGSALCCSVADLPLALSRGTVRTGDEAAPARFVVGELAQLGFTTGSPAQIPRVVK